MLPPCPQASAEWFLECSKTRLVTDYIICPAVETLECGEAIKVSKCRNQISCDVCYYYNLFIIKINYKTNVIQSKNVYWIHDWCILHFTNVSLNVNSKISCLELIFLSNSPKQDTFKGI